MAKAWFISDTHFNHRNIAKYCGRPENHEELMWEGLQCVQPEDALVHVGDVVFARNREVGDWLERLPEGRKILVEGNHDKRNRRIRKWEGWERVVRYQDVWRFNSGGTRVAISHRPHDFENQWHTADIFIHGHTHNVGEPFHWRYKPENAPKNWYPDLPVFGCLIVNVCVEQTGYRPISWDEILEKYRQEKAWRSRNA